uniref:SAM domain-containing protein n=1 Tax=Oreochromis aureus TaxID=47969 RepID=A0A668VAS5_OREAU
EHLQPVGPSSWSVEEVLEWIQEQYPTTMTLLHKAVIKHDITGRVLLRLKDHQLKLLGVEDEKQQQEILRKPISGVKSDLCRWMRLVSV